MTRNLNRSILVAALACAIFPMSARAESQAHVASSTSRPNIIFILLDDHNLIAAPGAQAPLKGLKAELQRLLKDSR
jgi:hypothetical protein